MRTQMFCSFTLVGLVACGGGGSKTPDAKLFLDAAIDAAPACTIKCELKPPTIMVDLCEGDNYKSIRLGTDAAPLERDNFFTFGADAGPLANRTAFNLALLVSESDTLGDVMFFRALKPTAGGFVLNTKVPFDPDPNSATPAAFSFLFGDVMINNNVIDVNTITQEYWATMGGITFTSIGEVDTSIIKGETAPTVWSEIDDMGAVKAGGCAINMAPAGAASGMSFTLKQKKAVPAFQPTQPERINGMRVLSPAATQALSDYIDKKYPHLVQ
jgi:hypothetical protein